MAEHLSDEARSVLAETGLHLRACQILGVDSSESATYEQYRDALIAAENEGAGKAYVERISGLAEAKTLKAIDKSEAVHRSAVSYLRTLGKHDYSDNEYIEAVTLVQSTKS